jgi:hypothetical protein
MSRRSQARLRDERGASMVIVLALMAIFGILMVAIGAQGQAGMLASTGLRNERASEYAAAGAMDGAINSMRGTITKGRDGLACPPFYGASGNVVVDCSPLAGSGALQSASNTSPSYALLTTRGLPGYDTGSGISTSGGNNPLLATGKVYSNTTIDTPKGLKGTESVGAYGACSGPITGNPVQCNTGVHVDDPGGSGIDPTTGPWAAALQSVPAAAPAFSCNGTTDVATMKPGAYYSLSTLTSSIGSCDVTYLEPGNYYFDFDQTDPSNTRWTIGNVVIGGTAKDWDPAVAGSSPTVPGACYVDDASHPAGVQLMFAGTSRIRVNGSGTLELCPTYSTTSQQIVMYGRKTDQPGTGVPTTYTPTGATGASPSTMGTPLPNVLSINGAVNNPPSGTVVSGKNAIGKVTLTGFDTSTIPAGSKITKVEVRVAHSENGQVGSFGITTTAGSQTLCSDNDTGWSASFSLKTDTLTCTPNLTFSTPADAQVTYQVKRPNNSSSTNVSLDGIEVVITTSTDTLKQQTLGTTLVEISPGGGNKGVTYLWGTVYAPYAVLNLDFKNNNQTAFARGVVINALTGSNVPPAQKLAPFSLPEAPSTYENRVVDLTARVNGRQVLKSRVEFDDDGGSSPGNIVNVLSWTSVNPPT